MTEPGRFRSGFDAHCHASAIAEPPVRLGGVVVAGVDPERWGEQLDSVHRLQSAGLRAVTTVGLHPWCVPASACALRKKLDAVAHILASAPAALVGVGETGLDTARGEVSRTLQLQAFEVQLELAQQAELPVVLHVVGAHADAQAVIRSMGRFSRGFQVHGFAGSAEIARAWVGLGGFLSIGGPVTWRMSAKRRAGIRAIPDTHLLVETDSPDQPVHAARVEGRLGRPDDLHAVIRALAEIRGQTPDHVERVTTENAHLFFGLDMNSVQPS